MGATRHRIEALLIAVVVVAVGIVLFGNHHTTRKLEPSRKDAVAAGIVAQTSPVPPCAQPTPAFLGACGPISAYAALNTSGVLTSAPLASDPSGLLGPDVSSYQPNVCWACAKRHIAFAFVKAGEGQGWTDPTFSRNWRALRRLRIPHGAYYFIRPSPSSSATWQADRFVNIVNSAGGFDSLPPVIDAEASIGLGNAALHHWIALFAARVTARTHRPIILYTGAWFWNPQVGGSHIGLLWVSGYAPRPAIPFSYRTYSFWQFTDGSYGPSPHSLTGVGFSDISVFHGSKVALDRLARVPVAHAQKPKPKPPVKAQPKPQPRVDPRFAAAVHRRSVLRHLLRRYGCRQHPRSRRCVIWRRHGQQTNRLIHQLGGK